MRVNKDNLLGAFVMLLIVAVIAWGVWTTVKLRRVMIAHDNLVIFLKPVIDQIQQANIESGNPLRIAPVVPKSK